MCNPVTNPFCSPALGLAGQQAAEQFLGSLAEATSKAAGEVVKMVLTWWVDIPSAEIGTDSDQVVPFLRGHTQWLTASLAVLALFIAAIRMALERNGREAAQTAKGMVWLVLVTGGGVATVNGLTEVGDWYAEWIIDQSTNGQFHERIEALAPAASVVLTSFMAIILFLFVVLSGLTQVVLMFGRDLGLVGLTGLLPVAAAAGAMGAGRQMRDKYLTWLLAAILYKPAAATVYAIGFKLVGDGKNPRSLLLGLVTFAAAVVALPALLRLIAPAVSVVASGGAGGAALAGVDAGVKLATGAMDMVMSKDSGNTGGIGGGPGGGPGGGSAPTGSGDGPSPGGGDGPGSGGDGLGVLKPAMPDAKSGAETGGESGSVASPTGTAPASGAGDDALVGGGEVGVPGAATGGTAGGTMGGTASGATVAGGGEAAGAAAGGPIGMAAVAGAEAAEKAASAGPKAVSAVGGAAASGAEEVGQ